MPRVLLGADRREVDPFLSLVDQLSHLPKSFDIIMKDAARLYVASPKMPFG